MFSFLSKKAATTRPIPAFTRKSFFRREQKAFYANLRRALPNCHVFPNVELRALMTPICTDSEQRRSEKRYLAGRQIDYAVFDANLSLLFVVELKAGGVVDSDPGSNAQLFKSIAVKYFCLDEQRLPTSTQMMRLFGSFVLPAIKSHGAAFPSDTVCMDLPSDAMLVTAQALRPQALEALAPLGHTKAAYPHVWDRIRLFCAEPDHLEDYLTSLSIQSRTSKRAGFPVEVLAEINDVMDANATFTTKLPEKPGWNDIFAR